MNLEFLQAVALSVANERSIHDILKRIVSGLADSPDTALARIWLVRPGDICDVCPAKAECPGHTDCLHVVASDGRPINADTPRPTRLDSVYRRFPLGVRKVGKIGLTGESILLTDIESLPDWLRDPHWARTEKVLSFAGQPLIFRGEILGVLAIFSRSTLTKSNLAMLRTFADNAAAAISNAKAFEEIEQLHKQLEAENEYLREEVQTTYSSEEIIGTSSAIRKILEQIDLVAPTETTVLVQGESGTGKELVAREIHRKSSRKDAPLVRVNCATIPRELFESEFFGHLKGSFTGAVRDRTGRFQLADGGTLFLDEVGEIPLELQSKLLRVLQEGEFEPVGEDKSRSVDVRIIAATNRDLKTEVGYGRFREDLYYRLSVFPIEVVPLREHPEDIGLLASHFLEIGAARLSKTAPLLKQKHIKVLEEYGWPGNIRELVNVIERALITSRGGQMSFDGLETDRSFKAPQKSVTSTAPHQASRAIFTFAEMKAKEREHIIAALEVCGWRIGGSDGAAALLGTRPTTLSSKIKAMNITRHR